MTIRIESCRTGSCGTESTGHAGRRAFAAALLASASAWVAPAASAQVIDEIVVTAQKRETSLQDTALAISAFSGEALLERGLTDLAALESSIPALNVGQEQDGFKVAIRGIGQQGTGAIADPGVAFYVDGFYLPRPSGGSATFFDVERVEVLRGPQGTLYGRNATGGVINVIAREPEAELGGKAGISVGERNLREVRGVLNVPISENILTRVTATYGEQDGYTENEAPGGDDLFGRDGDLSTRAQVKFTNNADFDVLASVTYTDLNGTGVPLKYLERNNGGPPPTRALLNTLPPDFEDPLRIATDADSRNDIETTMGFVRLEKGFGDIGLFVQAGVLSQDTELLQDVDATARDVSIFEKLQENDAVSLEGRLSYDTGGALTGLVGGYYFEEDTTLTRRVELNGLTPGGVITLPNFFLTEEGRSETAAVFGSGTFALNEQFSVNAGLRYTTDVRGGTRRTTSNFGRPPPPDLVDAEVDYDRITWKGGVEFRPAPGTLAYASISNGYKAGGFNLQSNGLPYEPEDVTAYEAGLKFSPLGERTLLNVDAFYYDYENLQLANLISINNTPGQFVTNATSTTVAGIETNGQVEVADGLVITGAVNYYDAEFDEYFNSDPRFPNAPPNPNDPAGLGRQDLSGNALPYLADWEASVGFRYEVPVNGSDLLTFAGDLNWQDDFFLREYNDAIIDRVEAHTESDASISYYFDEEGVTFTAYVTNIENDTQKNNIQVSPGFVGQSAIASFTEPRTIGFRADIDF